MIRYRAATSDFPAFAHGTNHLSVESPRYQIPDVKQNLLVYDTKGSYSYLHSDRQLQQQLPQQQQASDNGIPLKMNVPTSNVPGLVPDVMKLLNKGTESARGLPIILMAGKKYLN